MTTRNECNEKNKTIQNLLRNLQEDLKSIFYFVSNLRRSILNKSKKSTYSKDAVFVNLYNQLEDKNFYQNYNLPLATPFLNKRSNIDCTTLHSISKPFELLHDDIADLRFFAKSSINPKYCLLIVDLFSS